jgi:O-antigen ligase
VLVSVLSERSALRAATAAFVAGATVSGLLGIAGVGATAAGASSAARVGGGLGDPNYLAAVLVPGIVFALALRASTRHGLARLVLLAAAISMAFALLRTESRGGVVAFAAAVLAGLAVGGRLRRTILVSAGALLAGGAVYLVSASASAHRILSFGGGGSGRTELWSIALQAFRLHPLGGIGAGNFTVREGAYAVTTMTNLTKPYQEVTTSEVVHNTYLHVATELGVIGLVLLLVLVVGGLVLGVQAARTLERAGDSDTETLVRGLVVGAAGMFTAFVFLTAQYEKQLWIALGLLGAASALARTARSAPGP